MRTDEFISAVCNAAGNQEKINELRKELPLGLDAVGNVTYARKQETVFSARHTCVTGGNRSAFIRRLLITLSSVYEKEEACFFVLTPHADYGELVRLHGMDITLPYVRKKEDLEEARKTLEALLRLRQTGRGYPHLFLVLDGFEELEGCNRNGDLEEYRRFIEMLVRKTDADVITGVDLTKSIFVGYPGAFVGVGNCLVATREAGKADVTYVNDDVSLTLPCPISYPDSPSLTETVVFMNSIRKESL